MEKERIRILFWGDAVIETGFARVMHSIAKYLPGYYDISWIGVNHHGDPHPYPYRIYPAILGNDVYGINRLESIVQREKPQIIFIVNDAWVQASMLEKIKEVYKGKDLPKIFTYTPVDAEDHDGDWYNNFDIVTTPVVYTEFGKAVVSKAKSELESKLVIIPHGIDSTVFYKINAPKEQIKQAIYPRKAEFFDNSFIVLNAGRNQPRKRLDITMEAFSIFAQGKPENVKLYMHSGLTDSSIHLQKMSRRYDMEKRLILTSTRSGVQMIPTEKLNLIYNATDVGINTGVGEGWSLPNMEHSVTGAPQVLADHSALRELYYDCGLLVPTTTRYVLDNIMTTGYLVRPEDVAEKLDNLYNNRDLYNALSEKALVKFTSPEYSWEEITKVWSKLFEESL